MPGDHPAARSTALQNPSHPISTISIQVTTSPAGRTITRTFDPVGHRLQVDAPLVLPVLMTYDSDGRMQTAQQGTRQMTWTYGPDGLVATVTNPLGEVTAFARDDNGRVTATTRPDLQQILVSYDPAGNVKLVLPPGKPTHDFTFDSRELVMTRESLSGDALHPGRPGAGRPGA